MNYTFDDVATQLGVEGHTLIELLKKEGMLDNRHLPTERWVENGVFSVQDVPHPVCAWRTVTEVYVTRDGVCRLHDMLVVGTI